MERIRRRTGLCVRPRELGTENRRGELSSRFPCRHDHSNRWLTESPCPFFSFFSIFAMICFHHCPALPCIALHCIDLSEHQVPSANDAGGDRCVRCVHAKSNVVARGWHASWTVGIPQLRHSWTLIDKVFSPQAGARGVRWVPMMKCGVCSWAQGILVSPSRTETAAGGRQDAHHILYSRYGRVQFCTVRMPSNGTVDWQRLRPCERYHAMPMI